ncbi:serine/threonine-protein kinase [Streptomyces radicis]|nr:serine/threonine-protein kinase [Streptomyces radicis]
MDVGDLVGGRYRLRERFAEGAVGQVWRATDELVPRTVVLKRTLIDGERGQRAVLQEAAILAETQHPHVVTLHDVIPGGAGGGDHWLVMEYVTSRSLAGLVNALPGRRLADEDGVEAWRRAAEIGVQLAEALRAVHAKGVVHRDVKPGNVLVADNWFVKLGDFGNCGAGDPEETQGEGPIPRTPAYAAPEVHRGGVPSRASDVFSLGATLFRVVEGHSLYGPRATEAEMEMRARAGAFVGAERAGRLGPVLDRLLEPRPEDRPDAAEAVALLRGLLPTPAADSTAAGARSGPEPVDAVNAPSAPPRSRRLAWAAWAGVGLVALAATVVVGLRIFEGEGNGNAPPADPPPVPDALRPQDRAVGEVVGHAPSADPCALVDPAGLAAFGDTELDRDYGNFDRCDIRLLPPEGGEVVLMVDLNNAPAPEISSPSEQVGDVRVVSHPSTGEDCTRFVLLPDGNWLTVAAKYWDDGAPDLCAIADAGARHAADVVNEHGTLPRRPAEFPPGSLARYSACALLDTATLTAAVPGLDTGSPNTGFAEWQCEWYGMADDATVMLRFDRAEPLTAEHGHATQFNGYDAAVGPEVEGPGTCRVILEYRHYTDEEGNPAVEKLFLVVGSPDGEDAACAAAGALMTTASAVLPPPPGRS